MLTSLRTTAHALPVGFCLLSESLLLCAIAIVPRYNSKYIVHILVCTYLRLHVPRTLLSRQHDDTKFIDSTTQTNTWRQNPHTPLFSRRQYEMFVVAKECTSTQTLCAFMHSADASRRHKRMHTSQYTVRRGCNMDWRNLP